MFLAYQVQSNFLSRGSSLESARSERETGPLLPFSELVDEPLYNITEEDEDSISGPLENSALPDPCALVHVTSRKKPSIRQKNPVMVSVSLLNVSCAILGIKLTFINVS